MAVLHYLARECARKGTKLIAAVGHTELLPIVEESIRLAYTTVGKPEGFKSDSIRYIPEHAYTVGMVALMKRENITSNVFAGPFYHEAIILCEAGNALGCFQIGATAFTAQLPWMVACCNFNLIGEELMAAGAYLSKDPLQLGSLVGEDMYKAVALVIGLAGVATISLGSKIVLDLLKL